MVAAASSRHDSELLQALDRITDGLIVYDRAWRFVYLNRATEQYLGRSRHELVGRVVWEVFPEAVGTEVHAKLLRAAQTGETIEYEALSPAMHRWVAFRIFPSRHEVSVTFRDVTEQRKAAEALRASEARHRAVFEHALDAVMQTSTTGEIFAANEAACRMLGRTEAEICALGRAGIIDPSDPRLPAVLEERQRKGHVRAELRCVRKDGTTFPAEISSAVFVDAEGRDRTIITLSDLTDQKRAEERLRLMADAAALGSSLEVRTTVEALTALVVPRLADYCVVDFIEEGSLIRVAASHRDPLREASFMSIGSPGPLLERDMGIHRVARTSEPELVPDVDEAWLRAITRDDERFPLAAADAPSSAMVVPIAARGKILGVLSLFVVDHRRRYDADDLATARAIADRAALALDNARLHEQAIEARRLRDEVLGVVSHDLRNPLNTILIGARLLGRERDAPEIASITRAVRFADRLIQDLLTVAALEGGEIPLDKQRQSMGAIIEEAIALHRDLAKDRSLALEASIEEDLPEVEVDQRRILQVLGNLLGNALKFTPAGGSVRVEARKGEGTLVVTVSDTGPGIAAAALPHVFDRFWQGAGARRTGAGLGLAIAKGIVEAHHGSIEATSVVGRGATFRFVIPARPDVSCTPVLQRRA